MLTPLVSETFVNRAVSGAANYPKNGSNGSSSAAATTINFVYDSAADSYTVTNDVRSQTFARTDLDAAQSNASVTTFLKTSGATTDSLVLSNPGTSGQLNYQYVGSGFWQRTIDGATSIDATLDAFVYGVISPDAAVRRMGAAVYSVDLQGVISYFDIPSSLLGSGELLVDFETNEIALSGTYSEITIDGQDLGTKGWDGAATLSSSANAFNGTINIGTVHSFNPATLSGAFFGPNGEELGATFSGAGQIAVVGTIIGRYDSDRPSSATNKDLVNLTKDTYFSTGGSGADYSLQPDGTLQFSLGSGSGSPSFDYTAATQAYHVSAGDAQTNGMFGADYTFTPADLDATNSDSRFAAYTKASGTESATLRLYRPAGSNSELQLTYTGFGNLVYRNTNGPSGRDYKYDNWFIYRLPAGAGGLTAVPVAGSATYNGLLYGIALPTRQDEQIGTLSGTGRLDVDFAAASFSGQLLPIANFMDGTSINLGTYNIAFGSILGSELRDGQITGPGDDTGSFGGYLTGPTATEVGGVFSVNTYATPAANEYGLRGIFIGKRD